jgi:hypothetical protein
VEACMMTCEFSIIITPYTAVSSRSQGVPRMPPMTHPA